MDATGEPAEIMTEFGSGRRLRQEKSGSDSSLGGVRYSDPGYFPPPGACPAGSVKKFGKSSG